MTRPTAGRTLEARDTPDAALHRAVFLAHTNPEAGMLLTTFSDMLANALGTRLSRLISHEPRLGERLAVHAMNAISRRLSESHFSRPKIASRKVIQALLAAAAGSPAPSGLSADEKRAYETLAFAYKNLQYGFFMGSRPQTLYGIADSPVGVAAWMLDHDPASLRLIARAFDGQPTGLTRDDVLDNTTLFWLTNTTISAARLYWEAIDKKTNFFGTKNVSIPVAVSVFPDEIYHTPRSWAERAYPKLISYNTLDKGGHFAAWEQPELFVKEVRAGFRPLRT